VYPPKNFAMVYQGTSLKKSIKKGGKIRYEKANRWGVPSEELGNGLSRHVTKEACH